MKRNFAVITHNDAAAVELAQQIADVLGQQVHDAKLQRLRGVVRPRLQHSGLKRVGVTTTRNCNASEQRSRVLGHLARQRRRKLFAYGYRRSRPDVGDGCHSRDVSRCCDERTCGSRVGPRGSHVHHHRDLCVSYRVDHVPGRVKQTAGSVQPNQQKNSIRFRGTIDDPGKETSGRGADGVVDVNDRNIGVGSEGVWNTQGHQCPTKTHQHDGDGK